MEIYYTFPIVLLIACLFDRKNISIILKRNILIILCLFYSIVGGFGYWPEHDWTQYKGVFNDAKWSNIFDYVRWGSVKMEFGYMFLNIIFKTLFNSYSIFMFCMTLFYLYSFAHFFLKYSQKPIIIFTIFFLAAIQFIVIRQSIAIAIFVWALPYIQTRKIKPFFILSILAATVHESAIIMLFTYLFSFIPINYFYCNLVFIASLILGSVFRDYFVTLSTMMGGNIADKVGVYENFQLSDKSRSITTNIFNLLLLNIYLFTFSQEKDKTGVKWRRTVIWGFILASVIQEIFLGTMSELARIASYFRIFVYIFWADLIWIISKKYPQFILILYVFLICYLFLKAISMPYFGGEELYKFVPYKIRFF